MRKVTVYTTSGRGQTIIESQATTWAELQNDLSSNNIAYSSSFKAIIGETRMTVESDNAVLPESDFTLFLMQKKSKAGSFDVESAKYSQMKAKVKELIATHGDKARKHFTVGSKNYTQFTTTEMRATLKSWFEKEDSSDAPAERAGEEVPDNDVKAAVYAKVQQALTVLREINTEDVEELDDESLDEIDGAIDTLSLVEERLAPEEEGESLDKWAEEIRNDFRDVR